LRLLA
jgi:hypothetical protein